MDLKISLCFRLRTPAPLAEPCPGRCWINVQRSLCLLSESSLSWGALQPHSIPGSVQALGASTASPKHPSAGIEGNPGVWAPKSLQMCSQGCCRPGISSCSLSFALHELGSCLLWDAYFIEWSRKTKQVCFPWKGFNCLYCKFNSAGVSGRSDWHNPLYWASSQRWSAGWV